MRAHALNPLAPAPPPTQDELPYDDGEPMESPKHREQMALLIESLRRHLPDRPDVYIGGNMGVYYSVLQARNNDFRAPDFFVVLDAIPNRERKSWVVWEEDGRRPDVVIELLSASTEHEDRGHKMRVYASLGVRDYYLFDPETNRLEGYRLDPARPRYINAPPGPDGEVECATLGLRLVVAEGTFLERTTPWLRWKTGDGRILPTGEEAAREERSRAESAETRAESAETRAETAEEAVRSERARAERLAARLRALGVDPES